MFKTLLIKEIQSAITDFRFWVVMALCLCIIPLSFYVSVKNYNQEVADYQQDLRIYKEMSAGKLNAGFNAEGVRIPSPLSIFSQGLDNKIPYKVTTSRDGQFTIDYKKPDNKEDLLGEIDFAFIVVFVLSILAIAFTFSTISGDKEAGVFRAILSNAVLRRQILMAKLVGNYIVFIIPFIFSVFVALFFVYFMGSIPIFSAELFPSVLIMIGLSLLFLFALFNLGLWISSLAKTSVLSITILLLIWILVGLVIPKVSPIVAEAIYPVESKSIYELNKHMVRENILKEQYKEEGVLYEEIIGRLRPGIKGISTGWEDVNTEYDKKVLLIREKYEEILVRETDKLSKDYTARTNKQNRISKSIASLSLINSINNLLAEFSSTGYSEVDNFMQQARQYQNHIEEVQYKKMLLKIYRTTGSWASAEETVDGFNPKTAPVPTMDNYTHASIKQVVQKNWSDIILLAAYCILFFVAAFISFLRFDVR